MNDIFLNKASLIGNLGCDTANKRLSRGVANTG